ncbi:MAG: hypothetical protein O7G84_01195 [Gammaproteobacteria bacterium]|nr:hypothetical protein [Gammaproteobacteria bacterium]
MQQSLIDYVKLLGAINSGNQYAAAASDLTISKSAGTSNLPFLNGALSATNPNEQINAAADPTGFLQIYIDSTQPGGFNISPQTDVPAGSWDDGSDTLATVGMNNWAIYWMDFFNNVSALTIGQAEYNTLAAAEAALFTENPITLPAIDAVPNTRRTAIIVKGNASDLSVQPGQAKFVPIQMGVTGGASAVLSVFGRTGIVTSAAGDYIASQITFTPDGDIAAVEVQAAIVEVRDDTDTKLALKADASVVITAGAGLTGGGDLSASRTLDVVATDASIVVVADSLAVGVLQTDAMHGVRGGGTQHADVIAGGADGFMTGADKTKLDGIAAGAAALTAAAPADVTKAAAAVGVATLAARADHKHDISTAAAVNVGTANAEGSATSLSRSDHVHAHAAQTDGTLHADVIAGGADGFMTGADKTKLNGIEALADVTDLANVTAAGAAILAGQAGGQILIGGTATGDDLTLESTSFATKGDVIVAAGSAFLLNDMAAPANPSAGQGRLYKKTGDDGVFWKPDAAGPEVDLTANTGEVNTASNQGTVSLVLTKSGVDLPFRGLAGINNIGVAINGNDVEISGSLLAIAARDMIAGAGLTGGGDLSADRTFNVIANGDASIVVNANDIQVGVLATDAQHGVRGGGTQHADVIAGGADGFMTGADKTKLDGIATAAAALTGAAPADVTKAAAAVGVATLAARADHKHDISTAAAVNVGTVNAEGSATSLSRSDHVHAHAAQTDGTLHADVVAGGADGFMTGARAQLQDDMALFREWVPGGKLISITNSSWVITVNAPAVASAANAEKTVRVFDDTDDEGAGYELFVPTGATDVVFTMVTRPVSSPGGAVTSTWAVYEKDFGDDAVPGSWSAANALTTANHASGNLNVQYDETSFTLAGLGVAANQLHLLEFVRSGGTLTGDAELLGVLVEVV